MEDFASVTGSGARAMVGGREVLVGQPAFLTDAGIDLASVTERIDQLQAAGHTVIVLAADHQPQGVIALGDELRPDAVTAVTALRQQGLDPVLVTGDNERAARHVADQLGITQVRAGVRPEGKATIVRALQADGARATTGLVAPVWAMVAMAASVTTIFLNSIGARPSLLFQAISSVGRQANNDARPATSSKE